MSELKPLQTIKVNDYDDSLEPRAWTADHESINLQQVSNIDLTPGKVTELCQGLAELGLRLPGLQVPAVHCIAHLIFSM